MGAFVEIGEVRRQHCEIAANGWWTYGQFMCNFNVRGEVSLVVKPSVFDCEESFVGHAVEFLGDWLSDRGHDCAISREVGAGRHIADVVVLSLGSDGGRVPLQPLSISESVVLSSLRRLGATRIDLLEQRCGVEAHWLRAGALDRLIGWGLVCRQRGGRIERSDFASSTGEIIAIEAKLKRWRDALTQAVRYKQYADYSYVLLPEMYARAARDSRSAFLNAGVGLLVADGSCVTTVIEAPRISDHNWRREFVMSRLVLDRDSTHERG